MGEFIVAPAHADKPGKRFGDRDRGRQGEAALRRAQQQLQQAEAAQKRLQEAEAAQRRIQQLQEIVAAQQKRVQQLQQIEASQKQAETSAKKLQQIQIQQSESGQKRLQILHKYHPAAAQLSPANQPAVPKISTLVERHRAILEDTMAKLRTRHNAPKYDAARQEAPRQANINRHQAMLEQVTAKLRRYGTAGNYDTPKHAGFSHQSALQHAMDKLRNRHHTTRDHDRSDGGRFEHGRHESRQYAMYSHILEKFSRYGKRWREAKAEPAPAPVTPTPTTTSTQKKTANTVGPGYLSDAPDVRTAAATIVSKLPEVASAAASKVASAADNASDNTMSRLGGPKQRDTDDNGSAKSKTQKKDDDTDDNAAAKLARSGRIVRDYLPPPGTFKPNEVLIKDLNVAAAAKVVARGFKVLDKVEFPALGFNLTRLATPDTQNALIGRNTLYQELPSDAIELNHIYVAGRASSGPVPTGGSSAVPNGPSPGISPERRTGACTSDRCFGISAINWQPQLSACARGVKIGVIDTGFDASHPAFVGVDLKRKDFIPENSKKPSNQHGTGIFSLLAGNARSSTPGLVPEASFLVGDAFFTDRNGNAMSDTVTMLKALNWLKASGADIANLSFAGPPDELVHDAIRELAKTGTVILAAAGNEGQGAPPSYPAAYKEVIAVTAVDRNLAPYVYANRGDYIAVAAPGVDVWTALPNRREGPQTGTSFAVPFVTSVVALNYRAEDRSTRGDPLGPKSRALAMLQQNIKAIGGRGSSPIFGAGLVQAPSHCSPGGPGSWTGTVQVAPTSPTVEPQAGSWAGKVHPVANR